LQADFLDWQQYDLNIRRSEYDNPALTGSLGVNYQPKEGHQFVASVGTGFRSPNIDDLGKIFEFEPGKVVIPSEGVLPELAYSFDLTYNLEKEKLKFEASTYYTYLTNIIRRFPFVVNGDSTIIFDGEEAIAFSNRNSNFAGIFGASVFAEYLPHPNFSITGQITHTEGRDLSNTALALGHIPPTFGGFSARYEKDKWLFAIFNEWNAAKTLDNYSLNSEDKLSEALPTGTPKWSLFHVRTQFQIGEHIRINGAIDNILDEHYKPFAAGISGPGRNFKLGLAVSF